MQQNDDTSPIHQPDPREALVALGANLPGRQGGPAQAIAWAMEELGGDLRRSKIYRTPAFPAGSGPDFANAVIGLPWSGSAQALLDRLHGIEEAAGRTRQGRWQARVLDLDLLALGDDVSPDAATWEKWSNLPLNEQKTAVPEELILPHPRLAERAFVLVPLCDMAPGWRHPVLGRTGAELLADLPAAERDAVRPWEAD